MREVSRKFDVVRFPVDKEAELRPNLVRLHATYLSDVEIVILDLAATMATG